MLALKQKLTRQLRKHVLRKSREWAVRSIDQSQPRTDAKVRRWLSEPPEHARKHSFHWESLLIKYVRA